MNTDLYFYFWYLFPHLSNFMMFVFIYVHLLIESTARREHNTVPETIGLNFDQTGCYHYLTRVGGTADSCLLSRGAAQYF